VLGIVMFDVFNRSLDSRLASLELHPTARRSLENQRISLAAEKIPEEIASPTREVIREAINESFVRGFRRVMLVGAALALASSIASLLLINGGDKSPDRRKS
jgi:hypothetical protein